MKAAENIARSSANRIQGEMNAKILGPKTKRDVFGNSVDAAIGDEGGGGAFGDLSAIGKRSRVALAGLRALEGAFATVLRAATLTGAAIFGIGAAFNEPIRRAKEVGEILKSINKIAEDTDFSVSLMGMGKEQAALAQLEKKYDDIREKVKADGAKLTGREDGGAMHRRLAEIDDAQRREAANLRTNQQIARQTQEYRDSLKVDPTNGELDRNIAVAKAESDRITKKIEEDIKEFEAGQTRTRDILRKQEEARGQAKILEIAIAEAFKQGSQEIYKAIKDANEEALRNQRQFSEDQLNRIAFSLESIAPALELHAPGLPR